MIDRCREELTRINIKEMSEETVEKIEHMDDLMWKYVS